MTESFAARLPGTKAKNVPWHQPVSISVGSAMSRKKPLDIAEPTKRENEFRDETCKRSLDSPHRRVGGLSAHAVRARPASDRVGAKYVLLQHPTAWAQEPTLPEPAPLTETHIGL